MSHSPLRYPGGKQILARVLGHLIARNGRSGGVYVEPYAGGAGAALSLLYGGHVNRISINDADPRIHAFWDAVLNKTERFLKLLRDTPLTVDEWLRQRQVYRNPSRHSGLRVGFATFYLNRCNRSGIIGNAGLIGGLQQTGKWKLDARFNREELAERVARVARYRERIALSNLDAIDFLRGLHADPRLSGRAFVYLDPPYYDKGSQLYLDHYAHTDHAKLADFLRAHAAFIWVMSYDNVPQIRKLYRPFRQVSFNLGYSAHDWRLGKELLIFNTSFRFPEPWRRRIPHKFITAADRISATMPP